MPPSDKKGSKLQSLIAGGCAGFVESSVCHPLDTIKTRMQLRKNQVDAKHSLVEPALRIKHSLQEPLQSIRHSLQEVAGTRMTMNAFAATGTIAHEPTSASLRGLPPSPAAASGMLSSKVVVLQQPIRGTTVASLGPIGTAQRIIQREGFMALYKGLTAVYTGIIPKMAIRFVSFEQYKDLLNEYTPLGRTTTATFTAGLLSGLTEAVLVVTPAEVVRTVLHDRNLYIVTFDHRETFDEQATNN
jgi:hypothetical protein